MNERYYIKYTRSIEKYNKSIRIKYIFWKKNLEKIQNCFKNRSLTYQNHGDIISI